MEGTMTLTLKVELAGNEAVEQFARMCRVLYDNGFEEQVRAIVNGLADEAKKRGLEWPVLDI